MRVLKIFLTLLLLAGSAAFFYFSALIFIAEILPALTDGTLEVEGTSTILGRDWVRNEIYVLLVLYAAAAIGLLIAAIVLARKALQQAGHEQ